MLAKRIIPCLDVTNGRVVKGVNFVDLRDAGDPVNAGACGYRMPGLCRARQETGRPIRPAASAAR